ncbi:hypothetical protein [Hyperthermus butylicus]|uniref:Uncharacterized protein n=1 Tax=Hyperthermus butylicus (strain DSM 5456 / JCM 9403 / PLM1-5) TaxID=415426 RepID=A2BJX7_HYPBU|nr:hypothetical protein [Hyperthermus butylicus]ABM80288.1 hypothetical protein Hbut_0422 [Hyperthermus butylicus DSM 5456]
MSVPPAAEQPEIVEAEMGVAEYWYETFRRVLVIPAGNGCVLLSVDVYSKLDGLEGLEILEVVESGRVKVYYARYPGKPPSLDSLEPVKAELVVVEALNPDVGHRVEAVNVRLLYCGLKGKPGYQEVWSIYRRIVVDIEGRDPEKSPLRPPELVERVYRYRLG